jgi:hypothetical protein
MPLLFYNPFSPYPWPLWWRISHLNYLLFLHTMNSCIFIFTLLEHLFDLAYSFPQAINTPLIYWWNCYPKHSIYSRSSLTHQRCLNFISSYITLIGMKPVGLVPKFHTWISIKNSALSSACSRSYTRNIGAIRICKPCWPSYLHYSISRAIDLWLR